MNSFWMAENLIAMLHEPFHPLVVLVVAQAAIIVLVIWMLKRALAEQRETHDSIRGMVKKTEAITAAEREKVLRQYDRFMKTLLKRLPKQVAEQTEDALFRTEELILKRLAEIEPDLKEDPVARDRLDELVRSMEQVNDTLIQVSVAAVERAIQENRNSLTNDLTFSDLRRDAASS